MTPTVSAGGFFLPIQAWAHFAAFASMHIGSGPGVVGLSGMQVQPFFPSRKVFIDPSACAWTIVAPCEIDDGAADIALATRIAMVGGRRWLTAFLGLRQISCRPVLIASRQSERHCGCRQQREFRMFHAVLLVSGGRAA